MNIFERAAREKIRFQYLGQITTEDLWDLSVGELDNLYRLTNTELKNHGGEGLIKDDSINETTSILQLMVDLIRHVFEARQERQKILENEKIRREKKKRIMEIIANKQDQALSDMPAEELMKMLDEM